MKTMYESVLDYKKDLEKRIKELAPYTRLHPNKSLRISLERGKVHYRSYDSKKKKVHYLSLKEGKLISDLCKKRYAKQACKINRQNLKAANQFIKAYSGSEEFMLSEKLPTSMAQMCSDISQDYQELVKRCANTNYVRNAAYPEQLVHASLRGEMYRSKSECIIADTLYEMGIAYMPEPALMLEDGGIIYPDFLIILPGSFKTIYWEHFGMLSNPEYCNGFCSKIQRYLASDMRLGFDLICSFESDESPLSKPFVIDMIQKYILTA